MEAGFVPLNTLTGGITPAPKPADIVAQTIASTPDLSTLALSWISIELATWGEISMLMLGMILVCAMLIAPDGVFTGLGSAIGRATRRRAPAAAPNPEPAPAPASAMMPRRSQ